MAGALSCCSENDGYSRSLLRSRVPKTLKPCTRQGRRPHRTAAAGLSSHVFVSFSLPGQQWSSGLAGVWCSASSRRCVKGLPLAMRWRDKAARLVLYCRPSTSSGAGGGRHRPPAELCAPLQSANAHSILTTIINCAICVSEFCRRALTDVRAGDSAGGGGHAGAGGAVPALCARRRAAGRRKGSQPPGETP